MLPPRGEGERKQWFWFCNNAPLENLNFLCTFYFVVVLDVFFQNLRLKSPERVASSFWFELYVSV